MSQTETSERWATPHEVSDMEVAFPAEIMHLMPAMEDIPEDGLEDWERFVSTWFGFGLHSDIVFILRPGIDGDLMLRHIQCVMGSFQPKHEHKIAAVAYLFSLWCRGVKYAPGNIEEPGENDWKTAGDPTVPDQDEDEESPKS